MDQLQLSDQPTEVCMECFICGTDATEIPPLGDHKRLACPQCGEYKISNTAIQVMKNNWRKFDIERSREWLNSFLGSGQIPKIDDDKALGLSKL